MIYLSDPTMDKFLKFVHKVTCCSRCVYWHDIDCLRPAVVNCRGGHWEKTDAPNTQETLWLSSYRLTEEVQHDLSK